MAERFLNFIGGSWTGPSMDAWLENRNPADTRDVVGLFPRSGTDDVAAAVAAAREAFPAWSRTPAPERGDILRRVGDLMVERKEELARSATREMGKVLLETRGDVQEGIDTAYYAAGETRRLFGRTVPSELPRKWALSWRRPIGVCGIVTPFNFPTAIPTWKIFPALACGNTVVFKPSEDVPWSGALLVEILEEAGVPAGVVNLVHGTGDEVGEPLVGHDDVDVVSFTGSTATGSRIGEVCGRTHKRLSLEMGGKNAQIVLPDADLELALDGVLWGAFGTTGQRCTATSRLLLHREIHDEFVERLVEAAGELRLGDGLDEGIDVGPLIHEAALEKVSGYVALARDEGEGEIVIGGEPAEGDGLEHGHFYRPTVIRGVSPDARIAREEIFGPVLSVLSFEDFDEAVRINNDVRYGLSSAVYTRDVGISLRAMEELDNGITYVNAPTIGAEAHLPFGGVKETGNGHREGGWEVYEFYTETKVGYLDFSGRLQRAQIDTGQTQ